MSKLLGLLVLSLSSLNFESAIGITARKFVYQKDMSEHCKRRVVPSVFLGRQVIEAHSQILHFSKMELPYSCFISVRAESGSNIVLVIQLLSDKSLAEACLESSNQLLVYEIGETFGGYWGPLPDSVMRQRPANVGLHTRRTTQAPVTKRTSFLSHSKNPPEITTAFSNIGQSSWENADFIRVEVPIVNVSALLVPGMDKQTSPWEPEDNFDLINDVTPRRDVKYDTNIVPVVQFSIESKDGRRDGKPLYNLNYEGPAFTADDRLIFPFYSRKITTNRKGNLYANRVLNFKNLKTTTSLAKRRLKSKFFKTYPKTRFKALNKQANLPSSLKLDLNYPYTIASPNNNEELDLLIKNLNDSTAEEDKYHNGIMNISRILEVITNIRNNNSVYLHPDWELFVRQEKNNHTNSNNSKLSTTTREPFALFVYTSEISPNCTKYETTIPLNSVETASISNEINVRAIHLDKDQVNGITVKGTPTVQTSTATCNSVEQIEKEEVPVSENYTIYKKASSFKKEDRRDTSKPLLLLKGSMVNHKSWENVVQAAPVMAVLLNQTSSTITSIEYVLKTSKSESKNNISSLFKKQVRMKRKFEAISIEDARPHKLSTRELTETTPTLPFGVSDMQDFAQLVELQDDEMHDRIALRYLRQYVGPSLFNICDTGEPKARHVYLFNSSRIIMAINNFTLERMTVILTPGRSLLGSTARCPPASLECQVYGTRICIDSMNACDGVPNCGAYDIYDEDRLMCGAAVGLQHTVYLAAFTFLAVLLTVMYTVHYWLRRCVPRVSEAFFIYTNGAENILNLEPIMRSPHDTGEGVTKMTYHGKIFDDNYFYSGTSGKNRQGILGRVIRAFVNCCKRSAKKIEEPDKVPESEEFPSNYNEPRKMFSFAELELSNIINRKEATDAEVQTGESLEMAYMNKFQSSDEINPNCILVKRTSADSGSAVVVVSPSISEEMQKHLNELHILKFYRDAKTEPRPSTSRGVYRVSDVVPQQSFDEERELESQLYEQASSTLKGSNEYHSHQLVTTCDVHAEKTDMSKPAVNRVKRLRFDEDAIAIPYDYDDDEDDMEHIAHIALGDTGRRDPSKTEEGHPSCSGGRDFKRFWKTRKSKKKAQLPLN